VELAVVAVVAVVEDLALLLVVEAEELEVQADQRLLFLFN
jgi:hypothetical protein